MKGKVKNIPVSEDNLTSTKGSMNNENKRKRYCILDKIVKMEIDNKRWGQPRQARYIFPQIVGGETNFSKEILVKGEACPVEGILIEGKGYRTKEIFSPQRKLLSKRKRPRPFTFKCYDILL